MRAALSAAWPETDLPPGVTARELTGQDVEALGLLMSRSLVEVLDSDGDGVADHIEVAGRALAGQFGALQPEASLAAIGPEGPAGLIAATVVTHWRGRPLLAFALVDPGWQGRGLGTALLTRSASALRLAGATEWTLAVARQNRAVQLYRRLGFAEELTLVVRPPR